MKTLVTVLRQARKLIEKPEAWCQGAYNNDQDGVEFVNHRDAVRWCAEGALLYVCDKGGAERAFSKAYDLLSKGAGCKVLPEWNDKPRRKHSEVLAAFDRAIAAAKGRKP